MSLHPRNGYRFHLPGSYIAILGLIFLTSCSSNPNPWEPKHLATILPSNTHKIESENLKRIMHSLYYNVYVQERNALEIDERRRRYALRLADGVEKMSEEIIALAEKKQGLGLDSSERVVFERNAHRLGDQAKKIRGLADEYRMDELNGAIDNLIEICNGCHKRFRPYKQ